MEDIRRVVKISSEKESEIIQKYCKAIEYNKVNRVYLQRRKYFVYEWYLLYFNNKFNKYSNFITSDPEELAGQMAYLLPLAAQKCSLLLLPLHHMMWSPKMFPQYSHKLTQNSFFCLLQSFPGSPGQLLSSSTSMSFVGSCQLFQSRFPVEI